MSDFFSWFASTIGQWWTFLSNTEVPRCGFTFGGLFLFLIGFSIIVSIIHYVIGVRLYGSAADYKAVKQAKRGK